MNLDGLYVNNFKAETVCDYNHVGISGEDILFKENFVMEFQTKINNDDLKKTTSSPQYLKAVNSAKKEKIQPKELFNYDDYEEFGKDYDWFIENYGEPDELEDDVVQIILTYYDKNADYYLNVGWPYDKDGNMIVDDNENPETHCFQIDNKEGDDVVTYLVNPEYMPTEPETEPVVPNPNGPQ